MYSEKVMDHFKNPRNMGEIPDADAIGEVGNPTCGDLMYIYLKINDDKIKDISFQTFGCGAAVATSSMITELAKGQSLDDALKITRKDDTAQSINSLSAGEKVVVSSLLQISAKETYNPEIPFI
ncbi:MAG: iron-sulfur cluster assembly scaffold protein, partial [Promethearchaeota archaeon]